MKFLKWAVILIIIVVGGSYFIKTFNQPDLKQPINQLSGFENDTTPTKLKPPEGKIKTPLPNLGLQAKSVILMNAQNGKILYKKDIGQPLPTASMSKMMTELLVLEAIHDQKIAWDQTVLISDYVDAISNHPGFASVHLNKGQPYTVRELFNAMAIHSANGAAIALAETVAGSEKDFVIQMNEKAKELNLDEAHFVDSTGLNNKDLGTFYSTGGPNDTNVMSAKDVALLAKQLIHEFPNILNVVDEPKLTFGGQTYINTNWMLPQLQKHNVAYEGVDGLKTGFTNEAGYCFAGTVKKDDVRLISVVMGASSKVTRFSETERLYQTAFGQINGSAQ